MLLPYQLGVQSLGGVEPAIFILEEAISGRNRLGINRIASLDFVNAFNRTGRAGIAAATSKYAPTFYRAAKWAYNQPSILLTQGGRTLASAEGVRQGDPLAPLLFSLSIRPMLENLQIALPKATIIAYLDDIYVLDPGTYPLLPRITKALRLKGPITLNQKKCSDDLVLDLREKGLKVLGTFIGPLRPRRKFLQAKASDLSKALDALKDLPKQHALLLLRGSVQLLLRHLQRQLFSDDMPDLWAYIDRIIRVAVQRLIARESGGKPLVRIACLSIPVREGGLGISQHELLAPRLYLAAREACRPILNDICPSIYPLNTGQPPEPTAQEVYRLVNTELAAKLAPLLDKDSIRSELENASYLGRYWLRVLPTNKHNTLADSTVTEAIRTRLLLPIKPPLLPCSIYGKYPKIGREDVCRGAERRWIIRHNQVTRAFTTTLSSREDLKVESEPTPNLASSQIENQRRPDFSVLLGTSRHYYDVQIVAINKDSAREEAFDTLSEAAASKRQKYKDLGLNFHPLIFSAGGLREASTAKAYKALQELIGPSRAHWLDSFIALTLIQARGVAATSILPQN
ncbi:hypothetical protein VTL71DRAFT_11276 [Oculimacula yallundae]|uniref:Reverse transcriptase domain-containing protein n=1 Tax=Oculimacula yallundae TaxID=86028 RepID=A0ABR4CVP4_9HELO